MDEMTKQHYKRLIGKVEAFSSRITDSDEETIHYPVAVIRCFCDTGFSIEFASESFSTFGYDSKDLMGSHKLWSDFVLEKDFAYFTASFKKHCDEFASDFFCEYRIFNAKGETRNIISHISIIYLDEIPLHIECIFVDVTEDKQAHISTKRLISVINRDDIVLIQRRADINGNLKFEFATSNLSIYGYPKKLFTSGKADILDIIHFDDRDRVNSEYTPKEYNGNTYIAHIFRIVSPEEDVFWVLDESIISCENGKIITIESVLHNITDQKEATRKLYESQRVLTMGLKQSQLVSDILKQLQVTDDYDTSLKIILEKLADFSKVSSTTIFVPLKDKKTVRSYEWVNSDRSFHQNDITLTQIIKDYPNIIARLKNYGTAYSDAYGMSKGCEEEFKKSGYMAHIAYSICLSNTIIGYLIISDYKITRVWDNDIVTLVSDIAQIISGIFHRRATQEALSTANETFKTVLDNIDAYVYAANIETDEIIFTNEKFNNNFGANGIGKHCWEIFENETDGRCKNCYLNKSSSLNTPYYDERYCNVTDQWLDITEIAVTWNDGRLVRLATMNDITEKVEYEKLIEDQALSDHLTGLPNRRKLERDSHLFIEETSELGYLGHLLFLDLDNFKNINDGLGHQYGDALLKNIAEFLKDLEFTGNLTYRFGGDEFVIIVPSRYSTEIDGILEKILNRFREEWRILDTDYYCTMSMGVAKFPEDGTSFLDIMKKVDMAMYNAKKQGKNRIIHYHTQIGTDSIRRIEMERYMRESIANNCEEFIVYYQPIINTFTKQLEGAEALLRWVCKGLGMIGPTEFIPLAENLGLIVELGDFVLKEACKECKKWISRGFPDFKMNINLSVGQLIEPNIVRKISDIITKSGVPFQNIALEVTESLAINDMDKMKTILNEMTALGISISLDDFGTGYSSLNNIKEMPLNTIKIDKSFIDDLSTNSSTEIFVKMIINLAHALNIKVCAEGVEEEGQYNMLLALDADVIQGYYFGRPIPPIEFENKYNIK